MKRLYIFSLFLSFVVFSHAQSLLVDNASVTCGGEATVNVYATGVKDTYVAAGMVLQLADGLSVASNATGYEVTPDANVVKDHVVKSILNGSDRLKIAIYSLSNSPLNLSGSFSSTPEVGGEGQSGGDSGGRNVGRKLIPGEAEEEISDKLFFTLHLKAPDRPGIYECSITNIEYANTSLALAKMPDAVFKLFVGVKGDVNGDGTVSFVDISILVDIIMGFDDGSVSSENADINGDGVVTLLDITMLADIILDLE